MTRLVQAARRGGARAAKLGFHIYSPEKVHGERGELMLHITYRSPIQWTRHVNVVHFSPVEFIMYEKRSQLVVVEQVYGYFIKSFTGQT